jgi:hypothetical protein
MTTKLLSFATKWMLITICAVLVTTQDLHADAADILQVPWAPNAMVVDNAGLRHMVAEVQVGNQSDIFYIVADAENQLTQVENISANATPSHAPDILLQGTAILIVWQDTLNDQRQIFLRSRKDAVWQDPVVITKSIPGAQHPHFIDDVPTLTVEWTEYNANAQYTMFCQLTSAYLCETITQQAVVALDSNGDLKSRLIGKQRLALLDVKNNLWAVDEDGKNWQQLTTSGSIYGYAWSPTGEQIVYTYEGNVWTMAANGTAKTQLTFDGLARPYDIDWVQNQILFVRDYSKVSSIDLSTSPPTVRDLAQDVPFFGFGIHAPISWPTTLWSPDGQWATFELYPVLGSGIVGRNGTNYREYGGWQPSWKPDSTQILHLKLESGGLYLYAPSSHSSTQLSATMAGFSAYSPDERYIAYTTPSLWRMDANGSNQKLLGSGNVADPVWSPDSKKIAYATYRPTEAFYEFDRVYVINADGSNRTTLAYGHHPKWQPTAGAFLLDTAAFIKSCQTQIQTASKASDQVTLIADYFLDKQPNDEQKRFLNATFNLGSLFFDAKTAVDWSKVGNGPLKEIFPAYENVLTGPWNRGWLDPAAEHWYRALYDGFRGNSQLSMKQALQAGRNYYVSDAIKEFGIEKGKDWAAFFIPDPNSTPFEERYGVQSRALATNYQRKLSEDMALFERIFIERPLRANQYALHQTDMNLRHEANQFLWGPYSIHTSLLTENYRQALADEQSWLKAWGPTLFKYGAMAVGALVADGPGVYWASLGAGSITTIYQVVDDTRAIQQDQAVQQQATLFLDNVAPTIYSQLAFNCLNALIAMDRNARLGTPPQIASTDIGAIQLNSHGYYRIWKKLNWWVEERTEIVVPITNATNNETLVKSYTYHQNTGFWRGKQGFVTNGETLQLAGRQVDQLIIPLTTPDHGLSPDLGSDLAIVLLGQTQDGVYTLFAQPAIWNPQRIEINGGSTRQVVPGTSAVDLAAAPVLPYPIAATISPIPETINYRIALAAVNPFTTTVRATLVQPIPAGFSVIDLDGGEQTGALVTWHQDLAQDEGLLVQLILSWDGKPGEVASVPGAQLTFIDPESTEQIQFDRPNELLPAAWPLSSRLALSPNWSVDQSATISLTLTNLAMNSGVNGTIDASLVTLDGKPLWTMADTVEIVAGNTTTKTLTVPPTAYMGTTALQIDVTINGVQHTMVYELITIQGMPFYLPIIANKR